MGFIRGSISKGLEEMQEAKRLLDAECAKGDDSELSVVFALRQHLEQKELDFARLVVHLVMGR